MTVDDQKALVGLIDKKMNRQLKIYLDICARCAICRNACHQYVTTKDIRYLPAYRAELIRRIYKKYFSKTGQFIPALYEGRDPDEDLLEELYQTTYACTGCRRCMFYCPFSIDTTWILSIAKGILIAAGKGSEILTLLSDTAIEKGKSIDLFKDVVIDAYKASEEEFQKKVNDPNATFPIDKEGADVLYAAVAGTHNILPGAAIFHQAGENWALSMFEIANYGYFLGDTDKARQITARTIEEAKRLGVKEIVITECGHAHRVLKYFYSVWAKEELPFKVTSILEKMHEYIENGRIEVKENSIKEAVTYHDPCQIARNYGIFEQSRNVAKIICSDFREMTPNREKNWCCGGGGGLIAEPSLEELRIRTGKIKVDQIKATEAKTVITPCENCRLQLDTLNDKYNMNVNIVALMNMVADALIIK